MERSRLRKITALVQQFDVVALFGADPKLGPRISHRFIADTDTPQGWTEFKQYWAPKGQNYQAPKTKLLVDAIGRQRMRVEALERASRLVMTDEGPLEIKPGYPMLLAHAQSVLAKMEAKTKEP